MSEDQSPNVIFELRKIYLKDMSYESPQVPQIFTRDEQPAIDVQMRIDHSLLDKESGFYESVLTVTVTAKLEADTVFLVEVQQAGIFQIDNVADDEIDIALEVACPTTLFPYARETISELIGKGGFPQLLLNPVNFEAMYQRKQEEKEAAVTESASHSTH